MIALTICIVIMGVLGLIFWIYIDEGFKNL